MRPSHTKSFWFAVRILIEMSRFRRGWACAAALALVVGACDLGKRCGTVGCVDGLVIRLEGDYEKGKMFELVVDQPSRGEGAPALVTCSFRGDGATITQMACMALETHLEWDGEIHLPTARPAEIRIVLSAEGDKLVDEIVATRFVDSEPNGPGCETCSAATVPVRLP